MKKNGHKLLTLAALLGTATGVIHITNRFIDATSQLKDIWSNHMVKHMTGVLEKSIIQSRDMVLHCFSFTI